MKKYLIISIIVAVFLSASGFAEARNHNSGHQNGNHNSYGYNQNYGNNRHNRNGRYNRSYNRNYGRHNGNRYYGNRYSGHSSRHHLRDGLKFAAGALLVGSIIHAASNNKRDRVVVQRRSTSVRNSNYWYRVDNEGQCVEVRLNQQGQEVWTYVDPSYCN